MPRAPRREISEGWYYVTAAGNRGQEIFLDAQDARAFLALLGEIIQSTGWRVCAYLLQPGAYHLLLQTPQPNLVAGMQRLQNSWTKAFNRRNGVSGRLFCDRYRSVPLEGRNFPVLLRALAELQAMAQAPSAPRLAWSLEECSNETEVELPRWLALDAFFEAAGASGEKASGWALRQAVQEVQKQNFPPGNLRLDRGWYFGSRVFALELSREGPKGQAGKLERGPGQILAEAWLEDLRADPRWEKFLATHRSGSHPVKVALARFFRENTTASLGWIAKELQMKSAANVCRVLRQGGVPSSEEALPEWLAAKLKRVPPPQVLPDRPPPDERPKAIPEPASEPLPTWLL